MQLNFCVGMYFRPSEPVLPMHISIIVIRINVCLDNYFEMNSLETHNLLRAEQRTLVA